MLLHLKRLALKGFISLVRVGAVVTYYTKRSVASLSAPVLSSIRFVLRVVGVPLYRGVFFVRRWTSKIYLPAKHRLVYVLTNRYAIHALVVLIGIATISINVQASTLREEDFGQQSILYGLVAGQTDEVVEIVMAEAVAGSPSRYLQTALSVQGDIDFHNITDEYVTTTSGGSTIVAQTISESEESVAPRTESVTYTIEPGDTIGTIAQKHGISINTLLWANDLSVRSVIQPGDTLTILPVDGLTHTVKSGDTVLSIAKRYGSEAEQIVQFNRLANANDLHIGEKLIVPGGTPVISRPAPARSVAQVFTNTPAQNVTNIGSTVGSGRMQWPTDLRLITQYYGWRHTGIDIDCYFDNTNYAADDGIVQFVGWKGGYGNTVEVNHGNGIVTRYGHAAKNYVSPGQSVSKGTPLQLCGTTGRSTGTHLHFEVIIGGKFRNPLEFTR